MITNEGYNRIAKQLLESEDPAFKLLELEEQHLTSNPAFWHNLHLTLVVMDFNQRISRRYSSFKNLIEAIQKREEVHKLDWRLNTSPFHIDKLYFFIGPESGITSKPSHAISVCCERTLGIMEGLREFEPSKDEFDIFIRTFRNHPLFNKLERGAKIETILEEIFNRASLLSTSLYPYFLDSIEEDSSHSLKLDSILKLQFQKEFQKFRAEFTSDQSGVSQNKDLMEFTNARQVLAMHYIFQFLKVENVDRTAKARFIRFFTGKDEKNIYDALANPLASKAKNFRRKDLQFIRSYFENLGLDAIVKMIDNELDKPNG